LGDVVECVGGHASFLVVDLGGAPPGLRVDYAPRIRGAFVDEIACQKRL
jgi:hypothetical protein